MSDSELHILAAFDRDLESLQAHFLKLSGLTEQALTQSAKTLETLDAALADQVSIAIENARLFDEAQTAIQKFVQTGWSQFTEKSTRLGVQYSNSLIQPLSKTLERPEITAVIESGETVTDSTEGLKQLHESIRAGLAREDAQASGSQKRYGFRKYEDFRWEADAIEAALTERGEQFTPIPW